MYTELRWSIISIVHLSIIGFTYISVTFRWKNSILNQDLSRFSGSSLSQKEVRSLSRSWLTPHNNFNNKAFIVPWNDRHLNVKWMSSVCPKVWSLTKPWKRTKRTHLGNVWRPKTFFFFMTGVVNWSDRTKQHFGCKRDSYDRLRINNYELITYV